MVSMLDSRALPVESLCCVLGQDTLLQQCLSLPRELMGTKKSTNCQKAEGLQWTLLAYYGKLKDLVQFSIKPVPNVLQDCIGFDLLLSVIDLENSRHSVSNQMQN